MSPGALPSGHLVFQLVVFPLILGVELKAHSLAQDGVLLSRWSLFSLFPPSFPPHDALNSVWASLIAIYWVALLLPVWENDTNLWVTKFIIHCKMQDPQSRTIKVTVTVVNIAFHQSPFTQHRTEVQKERSSSDIAFTWPFMSPRVADVLPDKLGIYTQHSTLTIAHSCNYG